MRALKVDYFLVSETDVVSFSESIFVSEISNFAIYDAGKGSFFSESADAFVITSNM